MCFLLELDPVYASHHCLRIQIRLWHRTQPRKVQHFSKLAYLLILQWKSRLVWWKPEVCVLPGAHSQVAFQTILHIIARFHSSLLSTCRNLFEVFFLRHSKSNGHFQDIFWRFYDPCLQELYKISTGFVMSWFLLGRPLPLVESVGLPLASVFTGMSVDRLLLQNSEQAQGCEACASLARYS